MYFFYLGDDIVYAGSTSSIRKRFYEHAHIYSTVTKRMLADGVRWSDVVARWLVLPIEEAVAYEHCMITKHAPRYNGSERRRQVRPEERIQIYLNADEARRVRLAALERNMSLSNLASMALREFLSKKK